MRGAAAVAEIDPDGDVEGVLGIVDGAAKATAREAAALEVVENARGRRQTFEVVSCFERRGRSCRCGSAFRAAEVLSAMNKVNASRDERSSETAALAVLESAGSFATRHRVICLTSGLICVILWVASHVKCFETHEGDTLG